MRKGRTAFKLKKNSARGNLDLIEQTRGLRSFSSRRVAWRGLGKQINTRPLEKKGETSLSDDGKKTMDRKLPQD